MSKKNDIQFDDVDHFLETYPHFAIPQKPVPNYAAIRAVLRSGNKLTGVTLLPKTALPIFDTKGESMPKFLSKKG